MKKLLVSGAGGFVGARIMTQLAGRYALCAFPLVGAVIGAVIGQAFDGTTVPLVAGFLIAGIAAAAVIIVAIIIFVLYKKKMNRIKYEE